MKVPVLREMGERLRSLDVIWDYLKNEHTVNLKEIIAAFRRLDFQNNFESFEWTGTIDAGVELSIENKLRTGIPSKRMIVRSNIAEITDGASAWTNEFVTLKNHHATDTATLTVVFFK